MRVTNYMIGKWAKGGLLVLLGIVLLIYLQRVILELVPAFDRLIGGEMPFLVNLLNAIGWILTIWCFVDAALNILMSFRDSKVSLEDIGAKIDSIEKKIVEQQQAAAFATTKPLVVEQGPIGMASPTTQPINTKLSPPIPPPPP